MKRLTLIALTLATLALAVPGAADNAQPPATFTSPPATRVAKFFELLSQHDAEAASHLLIINPDKNLTHDDVVAKLQAVADQFQNGSMQVTIINEKVDLDGGAAVVIFKTTGMGAPSYEAMNLAIYKKDWIILSGFDGIGLISADHIAALDELIKWAGAACDKYAADDAAHPATAPYQHKAPKEN